MIDFILEKVEMKPKEPMSYIDVTESTEPVIQPYVTAPNFPVIRTAAGQFQQDLFIYIQVCRNGCILEVL